MVMGLLFIATYLMVAIKQANTSESNIRTSGAADAWDDFFKFWLVCSVIYAAVVWLFFWDSEDVVRWRLGSEADAVRLFIHKPDDCEFFTAPLGNKHCHYEPVIVQFEWLEGGAINWKKVEE